MKKFDFAQFYKNIQKDFSKLNKLIGEIETNRFLADYSQYQDDIDNENLIWMLKNIELKIEFVYDYLGLNKMAELLKKDLEPFNGKYDELIMHHIVDVFYSPVQDVFQLHVDAICSHLKLKELNENINNQSKQLLERILYSTGKIVKDNNIEPSNEMEVKKTIYNILCHIFPDTVREFPIIKVSKTFKPDIGIKKLKTAIEYKFVSSEPELKIAIGGVFEDVKGYEGSEDWKTFYAVFYMTDNFMTQFQVKEESNISKVGKKWKPILVFGKLMKLLPHF